MHGKSWQPSCAATAITPPALSSTLPSSFSTGLPSPLVASSPAINTKNSQGQTAPPRFIAYEFSDLSIAATCLYPVTADPHLLPLEPRFRALSAREVRGRALLISPEQTPWIKLPAPATSAPPQISEAWDFSISCISRPFRFRYRRKECFFSWKTIELYLLFETDGARCGVERKRRDARERKSFCTCVSWFNFNFDFRGMHEEGKNGGSKYPQAYFKIIEIIE